jgi:serine/threonine protein kinase
MATCTVYVSLSISLTFRSFIDGFQDNILINSSGRACIGDFALAVVGGGLGSLQTGLGSIRWMAPELLSEHSDAPRQTTASDVYALSVVAVEVSIHQVICPS